MPRFKAEKSLNLVLITGISGSGKSVALHALEDAGLNCVDNLPPDLLLPLLELERREHNNKLAVAIDIRHGKTLSHLPQLIKTLQGQAQIQLKTVFLDASDETLVRRYSETRRIHPLSVGVGKTALLEAIASERDMLADLRDQAHVLDTSFFRSTQLQVWVKEVVGVPQAQLLLVFESFAFKRGIPLDADYVFDVRMLPNPYYDKNLRSLTGKDTSVAAFLSSQPEVQTLHHQIERFLCDWLPALARDQRSYVTVAIGCTGGQHRSVYLVECLSAAFLDYHTKAIESLAVVARHRDMDTQ